MMERIIDQSKADFRAWLRRYHRPSRAEGLAWAKKAAGVLALFAVLYLVGMFVPEGFDYVHYFSQGRYPAFWIPWVPPIVNLMNMPALFAIAILGLTLRTWQLKGSPLVLAMAVFSLPTWWVINLGNVEGFVLLGLLILPWGAPFVLFKPTISAFALLARKDTIIVGALWGLLSLLIWGPWPLELLALGTTTWKADWVQEISLFPWGLIVALPLLWLSRGDEDLLMAAGSFATPHLFPYHFIVLMPAMARMRWYWALATWLVSFTPLLANWLGPIGWHFGNLMSVCFWLGIYTNRRAAQREKTAV